jgi:hypothetical protein
MTKNGNLMDNDIIHQYNRFRSLNFLDQLTMFWIYLRNYNNKLNININKLKNKDPDSSFITPLLQTINDSIKEFEEIKLFIITKKNMLNNINTNTNNNKNFFHNTLNLYYDALKISSLTYNEHDDSILFQLEKCLEQFYSIKSKLEKLSSELDRKNLGNATIEIMTNQNKNRDDNIASVFRNQGINNIIKSNLGGKKRKTNKKKKSNKRTRKTH